MANTKVLGTGMYVPPRVLTNNDLEKMMDTSDEWIRQRTGISERHVVEPGVGPSDLAVEAARQAVDNAGISLDDIDFIVFATLSPDHYFPGSGVLVQDKLGLDTVGALDIRQQCTGFIYGMAVTDQFIKTGMYKHILLIGAEVQSVGLDWNTEGRDIACLFGDGAGAVVCGPTEDEGVISSHLHCQGKHADKLWTEMPSTRHKPILSAEDMAQRRHVPQMEGRYVFKHAIRRFGESINEALEANSVTVADVDLFVFHQANLRITEMVCGMLDIPMDKTFNTIHKYGNTTAASIPICLHEAVESGKLNRGDLVCLVAFGSGFTWGSVLLRW
ncbi:MAG: ketoacyl-ACP synthase III [Candidatus Hydrogenedentes bacterium]|nr:ketoacyl-ACP synthase III [Candidatus Hydrogenedentota bacterium]